MRRFAAILLSGGVLSAAAVAGCGSSGATGNPLTAAMAQVADGSAATSYFEFGNVARLQALGATPVAAATSTYGQLYGIGFSQLASATASLPATLGYAPASATTAVSIGLPPHTALRLNGKVDAGAVTAKLKARGAVPRSFAGVPGLSFAADDQVNPNGPFVSLGVLTALNQVVVTNNVFASGPDAATVEQVSAPGTHNLASDGRYASLAKCLGSSVAAEIATMDVSGAPVQLVGVAVRDPGSSSDVTEVVCALPEAGQSSVVRTALGQRTSRDIVSDEPMTQIAQSVSVEALGPDVRATFVLRSGQRAGYLFRALADNEVGYWLGGAISPPK